VGRITPPFGDLMDIDSNRPRTKAAKIPNACFFKHLSARGGLDRCISDLDVATGLQPAVELSVSDHEKGVSVRRKDESRSCEVPWLELGSTPHRPSVCENLERQIMGRLVQIGHVGAHNRLKIRGSGHPPERTGANIDDVTFSASLL